MGAGQRGRQRKDHRRQRRVTREHSQNSWIIKGVKAGVGKLVGGAERSWVLGELKEPGDQHALWYANRHPRTPDSHLSCQ